MVANARHHGFRRFSSNVGTREALAETSAAVAAGDFDDDRVALFAALQRVAESLFERDT